MFYERKWKKREMQLRRFKTLILDKNGDLMFIRIRNPSSGGLSSFVW